MWKTWAIDATRARHVTWPQGNDANDQPEEALQEPMADGLVSFSDFIDFVRDRIINKALTQMQEL